MAGTGARCSHASKDDEGVLPPRSGPAEVTLLLVGKTGHGKSATGNSVLGWKAFDSRRSYAGVTRSCQRGSGTLDDGRIINVVDTPGLFDASSAAEETGEEIAGCMATLAKDGVHAVIVVFSAASRFSQQDCKAVESIQRSFGKSVLERVILVFTHGDDVEKDEWEDMLRTAPDYMLEVVKQCGGRVVLFDNRTKDARVQADQRKELLGQVESVMLEHHGLPFSRQAVDPVETLEPRAEEETLDSDRQSVLQLVLAKAEIGVSEKSTWYGQMYGYLKYTANWAWRSICWLWRKMADAMKGRCRACRQECKERVFSCAAMVQARPCYPLPAYRRTYAWQAGI